MTDISPPPEPADAGRDHRTALRHVEEALRGLQFGTVTLTVQDGVVVQVERTERRRLQRRGRNSQAPS
jgi:hypothetical protein